MTNGRTGDESQTVRLPNGAGVAAILASGIGSFVMAVLAILADHSPALKKLMTFYMPTGPLSGVTTTAIVVWLMSWIVLDVAWRKRTVQGGMVPLGLGLLAIGFLLMFPPMGDLF